MSVFAIIIVEEGRNVKKKGGPADLPSAGCYEKKKFI